jgi:hypothetical protein
VGFEPTVGFPTLDFESSALNRTQPPFLFATVDAPRRAAKYELHFALCKIGAGGFGVQDSVVARMNAVKPGALSLGPKKCYNFGLAMAVRLTAYCISARTATLLLVVDWYSQVVGAAVHQYSHLIRNLNPPSPP